MPSGSRKTLSRGEILRGRTRIRELLRTRPVRGEALSVYFRKGEGRQAGFFVPRRIGNAVDRNLHKRHMREIYRKMRDEFPEGEIIFRMMRKAGWDELCKDFERCAERLAHRGN